jgi:hemerythrin superfamily protein
MKVTVLLRNDHEIVKSLFAQYQKAGSRNQSGKREVFDEIRREILLHSQIEAETFYPELKGTSSKRAVELISAAEEEHRTVENLLKEMSPQDRNFDKKMTQLIDAVNQHIEREEEEILDEARKTLTEYRLEELGLEMEDRRRILTQLAA